MKYKDALDYLSENVAVTFANFHVILNCKLQFMTDQKCNCEAVL